MGKIKFWFNNARPQSLPQSVTPAFLAACMAFGHDGFNLLIALLALVGVICAHCSINLLDDYFDYKNAGIESREKLVRAGMRARLGKCPYLAEGKASLKETRNVAYLFGLIAVVCGCGVCFFRGWEVLIFIFAGAFLGYFYSGKPFSIAYHGLGELLTGLMFGPLLMPGMYFAACGEICSEIWFMSVAVGLLVVNILYTHSVLDCEADKSVSKTTLAVLLKTPARQLAGCWCFCFVPFLVVLLGVVLKQLSPVFLLSWSALPMSVGLFSMMRKFFSDPNYQYERKKWMGQMENWDAIVDAKIDWFMIRWFLARNIITLFATTSSVVAVVIALI